MMAFLFCRHCPSSGVHSSVIRYRAAAPLITASVTFSTTIRRLISTKHANSVRLVAGHWLTKRIQRCRDLSVGNSGGDTVVTIQVANIGLDWCGIKMIDPIGNGCPAKMWLFHSGIYPVDKRVVPVMTVPKAGSGQIPTATANSSSSVNTVSPRSRFKFKLCVMQSQLMM